MNRIFNALLFRVFSRSNPIERNCAPCVMSAWQTESNWKSSFLRTNFYLKICNVYSMFDNFCTIFKNAAMCSTLVKIDGRDIILRSLEFFKNLFAWSRQIFFDEEHRANRGKLHEQRAKQLIELPARCQWCARIDKVPRCARVNR